MNKAINRVLGTLLLVLLALASLGRSSLAGALPFVVTNTNDSGAGSLRQAILNANASTGRDTITFNIDGPSGVAFTIAPVTAMPTITGPVVIDGYSQPGSTPNSLAVGNNAVLLIEYIGSNITGGRSGFTITAGNSEVRGIVFGGWQNNAIRIQTNGGNVIQGNFIGTDTSGTGPTSEQNGTGISIENSSDNLVGGLDPADRNVISNSRLDGVGIFGNPASTSTGNVVQGNYIGTDKSGTVALGNGQRGVANDNAPNTLIGGSVVPARNLISDNNTGVYLISSGAADVAVQGNFIGTDITGTARLGTQTNGIFNQDAPRTQIGGPTSTPGFPPGNLISGNQSEGVHLFGGNAAGGRIQGNLVGTDITGTQMVANLGDGIYVRFVPDVLIGGPVGAGNVSSGNGGDGIEVFDASSAGTQIQGNLVGTDITGNNARANNGNGVALTNTQNVLVGGADPSLGNVIAHNTQDGVRIVSGSLNGEGNEVARNSIFENGQLGIDLGPNGVNANDTGDPDVGPNGLQNYPVLTSVISNSGTTVIDGTLNSNPNETFRIEFFAQNVADPTGYGEGAAFIGSTMVTTDSAGNATFTASLGVTVPTDHVVTATATDSVGNTSEFSGTEPVGNGEDTTPPVLTDCSVTPMTLPPGGGSVLLQVTALDNVQVAQVEAVITRPDMSTVTVPLALQPDTNFYFANFAVPANTSGTAQSYGVLFRARDTSGNMSTLTCSPFLVSADGVAPVIQNCDVTPRTLPSTGGNVAISATVTDNVALSTVVGRVTAPTGLVNVPLTRVGTTNVYQGVYSAPANPGSTPVVYPVSVIATDSTGNTSTEDCGTFQVEVPTGGDTEPPVLTNCTVTPRTLPSPGGDVTITVRATDNTALSVVNAGIQPPAGKPFVVGLSRVGTTDQFRGTFSAPPNSGTSAVVYGVTIVAVDTSGNGASEDCGTIQVLPPGTGGPEGGRLQITPARVNFGKRVVGSRNTKSFVLQYVGTTRGRLDITLGSLPAPFRVRGARTFSLLPRDRRIVEVEFNPTEAIPYEATLTIITPDLTSAVTEVRVAGVGCRNVRRR